MYITKEGVLLTCLFTYMADMEQGAEDFSAT